VVHLLGGLNGAGKTTYARQLAADRPAVRFSKDEWMLRLYEVPYDDPGYGALVRRCRDLMWDLAGQVLARGIDVILDWNCWSRALRSHWADRAREAGYSVVVHYVRVPVETAVARASARAAAGAPGSYPLDAAAVRHLAALFEEPDPGEGIEVRLARGPG
jgi:predicted kinase